MVKWGMVIDLTRCMGCRACMVACKVENNTPTATFWMYVFRDEVGKYPNVNVDFLPRPCMHCENPPCAEVCPTGARYKNIENGLVLTNYSICIGCKYCILACPYGVNHFNWEEPDLRQYFNWIGEEGKDVYGSGNILTYLNTAVPPYENPDFKQPGTPEYLKTRYKGIVEKCTFCAQRIEKGLKKGLKLGVDPEATPACVATCPVKALHFGDLDDPNSNVSKLLASRRWFRLREELGTRPQVYYLGGKH